MLLLLRAVVDVGFFMVLLTKHQWYAEKLKAMNKNSEEDEEEEEEEEEEEGCEVAAA